MPASQNYSNLPLKTKLPAPRYNIWCKIQVINKHRWIKNSKKNKSRPRTLFSEVFRSEKLIALPFHKNDQICIDLSMLKIIISCFQRASQWSVKHSWVQVSIMRIIIHDDFYESKSDPYTLYGSSMGHLWVIYGYLAGKNKHLRAYDDIRLNEDNFNQWFWKKWFFSQLIGKKRPRFQVLKCKTRSMLPPYMQ